MKKYKITITLELIEEDKTSNTFGATILEKIQKEKAEIERIEINNKSIIQTIKEYIAPYIKEINQELNPLGLGIFHKGSEWYDDRAKHFRLSHTFAVTTDSMVHFAGTLPYRVKKIGQKEIKEIIWSEDIQIISFGHHGGKYNFSNVQTMLQLHAEQIERAYREKIRREEYSKNQK